MKITYTFCDRCNKSQKHRSDGRGWFEGEYPETIGWNCYAGEDICQECVEEIELKGE